MIAKATNFPKPATPSLESNPVSISHFYKPEMPLASARLMKAIRTRYAGREVLWVNNLWNLSNSIGQIYHPRLIFDNPGVGDEQFTTQASLRETVLIQKKICNACTSGGFLLTAGNDARGIRGL